MEKDRLEALTRAHALEGLTDSEQAEMLDAVASLTKELEEARAKRDAEWSTALGWPNSQHTPEDMAEILMESDKATRECQEQQLAEERVARQKAEQERDALLLQPGTPGSPWQGEKAELKIWQQRAMKAEQEAKTVSDELHQLRCLLYEAGWDSCGTSADALRRLIARKKEFMSGCLKAEQALEKALIDVDEANAETRKAEQERDALASKLEQRVAEVEMLRGVGCYEDGDGPCGACLKCAKRERDAARESLRRILAETDQHGIGCASKRGLACNCARREAEADAKSSEPNWRERAERAERLERALRGAVYCINNHFVDENVGGQPCDCDQAIAARAALSEEPPSKPRASVGGEVMERSTGDFVRACEVLIAEEQELASPRTHLIAVLCDAVRLSREMERMLGCKPVEEPSQRSKLLPTLLRHGMTNVPDNRAGVEEENEDH